MKKIRLILIIIMSLFATLLSTVEAADIKVRAFYADNSVFLRWYPSTYDVYMKCINEGFVVERREANSAEGWARVSEVKKADFNTIMGFVQKEPNVEILGIVLYKSQYIDHNLSSNPELTKRDAEKKIAEVDAKRSAIVNTYFEDMAKAVKAQNDNLFVEGFVNVSLINGIAALFPAHGPPVITIFVIS